MNNIKATDYKWHYNIVLYYLESTLGEDLKYCV
jgi:hypothetical protein